MTYTAPLQDMGFVLNELCDLEDVLSLPGSQDASPDLVAAVLEEAARVASEVAGATQPAGRYPGCALR